MWAAPGEFDVSLVSKAPATLCVTGDIDLSTAPRLRAGMDQAIAAGLGDLVLDMSGVTFLDSSGLAVLFSTARRLRRREQRLVLRGVSRDCLRTMELVGLVDVLELEPDVPTAPEPTGPTRS